MSWLLPALQAVLSLSSTKVTVHRVAGSPRGCGHDILIKSTSTADCITQESKINHSQGSELEWQRNQSGNQRWTALFRFLFFLTSLYFILISLSIEGEVWAFANWKASRVSRALCIDFYSLYHTQVDLKERGIFCATVHVEGPWHKTRVPVGFISFVELRGNVSQKKKCKCWKPAFMSFFGLILGTSFALWEQLNISISVMEVWSDYFFCTSTP